MATAPAVPEPRDTLDALTHLVLEVSSQRAVEDVLGVALRQCLDLTASQFGFIGLVRPAAHELADGELEIVAIHGFHPAPSFFAERRVIPLRPNVFSRVILEDRAVRSLDAGAEPRRVGQPPGHPVVGAFLGVPLRLDGTPIGMIGLANRAGPYEDEHERLALTYATLVAVLVRNAQLYEQLQETNSWLERLVADRTRELADARDALARKAATLQAVLAETVDAQETERRRIAADIHDGITQMLVGAMLELTSGEHRIASGHHEAAAQALASARTILTEVESEIRRVVHDLHPPVLVGLGLAAALRVAAEQVGRRGGPACSVEVTGRPVRLPPAEETALYRVAQEALANACAHGRPTHVAVHVAVDDGDRACVTLTVRDDGCGFDPAAVRPLDGGRQHLGLESMRRRVEALAGRLDVTSAPGRGTTVRACVPLP